MADYTIINVDAGETFRKSLSNGETWENVLIDISARGAAYEISATGANWTIRNVGIRGAWDHSPPSSPINFQVSSSSATGLVENFYLGDGVTHNPSANQKPTGFYVNAHHAGELTIRNVNIQEMSDNAIYASSPGNGNDHHRPGSGGVVIVEDSYFKNNQVSDVRLGTDGSYAENCVGFDNSHRGYWGYYGDTEVIDCDFGDANRSDIHVGEDNYQTSLAAEVTVSNTRYDTSEIQGTALHGSSAGSPQDSIPNGVPTSAEAAASGASSTPEEFQIETADPTDVDEDSATIGGYIDDMGGYDTVTVWLEYRKSGTVSWSSTGQRWASSPSDFSTTLHGLDPFTEYEFRAIGETDDTRNAGETVTFRTYADKVPMAETFADGLSPYEGDVRSFDVSGGRLVPGGSTDESAIIYRPDMETQAGNTYEAVIEQSQASGADVGFLFGVHPDSSDWYSLRGYLAFLNTGDGRIEIQRLDDGDRMDRVTTTTSWPTGEDLTAVIDYRESDASEIVFTLRDASGADLASVMMDDMTYDSGHGGFYRYHADGGWSIGSYTALGDVHPAYVDHGSGEQEVSAIETDRGQVERIYVNHGDGNGEQLVFDSG